MLVKPLMKSGKRRLALDWGRDTRIRDQRKGEPGKPAAAVFPLASHLQQLF